MHGIDIPFALNNYDLTPMAGDRPENPRVGRIVSDTFVRFAQEGNPNHDAIPKWSPYSLDERATLNLDLESSVENDPRSALRELYAELLAPKAE
jgi:para-nitrobenzyl esterase